MKGELAAIETRIERQQLVDEAERRIAGTTIAGTGDDNLDTALADFSLVRAIICQIPNLNVDAGRERELSAELARRSGRRLRGWRFRWPSSAGQSGTKSAC